MMNYAKEAYMLSTELAARGYPSVYGDVFSDLGSGGDLATLPAGALVGERLQRLAHGPDRKGVRRL